MTELVPIYQRGELEWHLDLENFEHLFFWQVHKYLLWERHTIFHTWWVVCWLAVSLFPGIDTAHPKLINVRMHRLRVTGPVILN